MCANEDSKKEGVLFTSSPYQSAEFSKISRIHQARTHDFRMGGELQGAPPHLDGPLAEKNNTVLSIMGAPRPRMDPLKLVMNPIRLRAQLEIKVLFFIGAAHADWPLGDDHRGFNRL